MRKTIADMFRGKPMADISKRGKNVDKEVYAIAKRARMPEKPERQLRLKKRP